MLTNVFKKVDWLPKAGQPAVRWAVLIALVLLGQNRTAVAQIDLNPPQPSTPAYDPFASAVGILVRAAADVGNDAPHREQKAANDPTPWVNCNDPTNPECTGTSSKSQAYDPVDDWCCRRCGAKLTSQGCCPHCHWCIGAGVQDPADWHEGNSSQSYDPVEAARKAWFDALARLHPGSPDFERRLDEVHKARDRYMQARREAADRESEAFRAKLEATRQAAAREREDRRVKWEAKMEAAKAEWEARRQEHAQEQAALREAREHLKNAQGKTARCRQHVSLAAGSSMHEQAYREFEEAQQEEDEASRRLESAYDRERRAEERLNDATRDLRKAEERRDDEAGWVQVHLLDMGTDDDDSDAHSEIIPLPQLGTDSGDGQADEDDPSWDNDDRGAGDDDNFGYEEEVSSKDIFPADF